MLLILLFVGSVPFAFADEPNYIPCNYTVTIYYKTSPTSSGNINGFTNGQSQTFNYNHVPCQENTFNYYMYVHPEGNGFSLWQVAGGTLSSIVDNGTTLTVKADQSATITANLYTGTLIPLYSYPTTKDPNSGVTYWQDLINAKNSYPEVPVIAVVNPDNGPNTSTPATADPAFTSGMSNLAKAGIFVLGYVYTCFGQRPLTGPNTASECATRTDSSTGPEDDINTWDNLYGSYLRGIFLDQMDSQNCGTSPYSGSYYSTITTFAHNKGLDIVVGNPGCQTTSTYVGTVDIITPYEHGGLPSKSTVDGLTIGGFSSTISSQWGILAYGVSGSSLTLSYFQGLLSYIGWIYVTDAAGPPSNPWSVTASYLSTEMDYLAGT